MSATSVLRKFGWLDFLERDLVAFRDFGSTNPTRCELRSYLLRNTSRTGALTLRRPQSTDPFLPQTLVSPYPFIRGYHSTRRE